MGKFMSDYNFLMETRLPPEDFQVITQISQASSAQGLNLYLVGGAVRDLTYGQQTIRDLDFAVEGNPEKILRQLTAARGRRAAPNQSAAAQVEHIQHDRRLNSAEVVFSNGVRVEIAMCRSEFYPKPGKRPVVSAAMVFEDLRRRDFSANAMAVSLHPNSRGLLLDPTNGAADIEKRELRVMHSRSLSEDPSRIYRLLRLCTRLGFKPEERTKGYLENAIENRTWSRLSPEQQGSELRAILNEEEPARALKLFAAQGLFAGLDRKIPPKKIAYDRFKRISAVSRTVPGADPFLLNFHCLVAKLGGGQRARLAKKIFNDRKTARTALGLERAAKKLARLISGSRASAPSVAYKILEAQPRTLLLFLLVHYTQSKIQHRIKHYLHKAPLLRASLPRAEFLSLGAKPGPKFEKVLDRLFFDQLDGKIKSHPQLIKEFRRLAGIPEPKPPKPAKPPKPPKAKAEPKKPKEIGPKSAAIVKKAVHKPTKRKAQHR
jgi:tRNA nucleotidyltransferase (CCA-adding enzyme)